MYAVIFEKQKFLTTERKDLYLKHIEKFESDHPLYIPYNRLVSEDGLSVVTTTYDEIMPGQLDGWFHAQLNAVDTLLTTGSPKRTASNGFDPSYAQPMEEDM